MDGEAYLRPITVDIPSSSSSFPSLHTTWSHSSDCRVAEVEGAVVNSFTRYTRYSYIHWQSLH